MARLADTPSAGDQNASSARIASAWTHLARGEAKRGYLDCERGMMIAAIFMRDDARANAMWKQIGGASLEPAADQLAMVNPRANAPDPVIAAGVARALQGDFRGAIRAWSRTAVGGGPYDLTDKQTALVGLARARLGDGTGAEAAWIGAARTTRLLPQMAELYDGNAMALSMLMHVRAHFARGDRAYRWKFSTQPERCDPPYRDR